MFLLINGHHIILRALHDSFTCVPLMGFAFNPGIFDQAIKTFNIVIATSLKVAAPTMAALFVINLLFSFIARLVPQMNVFILSLPIKIGVGIFIVVIALPAIVGLFSNVVTDVVYDVYTIIHAF